MMLAVQWSADFFGGDPDWGRVGEEACSSHCLRTGNRAGSLVGGSVGGPTSFTRIYRWLSSLEFHGFTSPSLGKHIFFFVRSVRFAFILWSWGVFSSSSVFFFDFPPLPSSAFFGLFTVIRCCLKTSSEFRTLLLFGGSFLGGDIFFFGARFGQPARGRSRKPAIRSVAAVRSPILRRLLGTRLFCQWCSSTPLAILSSPCFMCVLRRA